MFSQSLQCSGFSASSTATFPQFCNFSTAPNVGTPAYFLALNAVNEVVVATGISAQPTITATNTNAIFYLTFAPNSTTTSSSPLYVDGGSALTYNAFSNTLTVPVADIPTSLTANGSFTANGSNSIAGYAPLNSPALTGVPTSTTGLAGTSSTQIATQEFVIDSLPSLVGYIQKTGTQGGINTTLQLLNSTSIFKVLGAAPRTYLCVDAALDRVEIGELRVLYGTICQAGLGVGGSLSVYGPSNPNIDIGATTAIGKATAATGLIDDSGASDLCVINYSTDIRFAARQNVTTNMLIANNRVEINSQYLHLNNSANPYLLITPAGGAGNYFAQATTGGAFISDSAVGDMCINSRTGNIRLAAQQYPRTNMLITNTGIVCQTGNMNSGPANWNNNGGLVVNSNGLGGNNGAVSIGYNDSSNEGYIISLSPSIAWRNLSYKGVTHTFYTDASNLVVAIDTKGLLVYQGGTIMSYFGAVIAGLSGMGIGDMIFQSVSGALRFYNGTTCKVAINSDTLYADTITAFSLPSVGISRLAVGNNQAGHRNTYGKLTLNSQYTDDPATGFVIDAGDGGTPAGNYRFHLYPYVQAGAQVGYKFGTHNNGTNYESFRIQHNGDVRFAKSITYAGVPSIVFEGNGVNYYMVGYQSGYWDTGPGGAGNWRMNSIGQLHLGADFRYINIRTQPMDNPNTSLWTGGCLFTQSWTTSQTATGLNIGFNEGANWGHIVCLQPSVAWKDMYINAAYIYAFAYGNYSAVLQVGGWINVSDEREKTNIRPLKTTRSLERVLSAKTFTYNRKFYLDSSGNDLTPQEEKDKSHVGIVAQQVKESNPHCLSTFNSVNCNNEERFGVNYNDYVVHLLGAVQEQQKQIDQLVKKDLDKDATIQQLVAHVAKLTEVVNKLSSGAITPR
jgi:hypothetical protein